MAAALHKLGYSVYDFEQHLQYMDEHFDFLEGNCDSHQLMEIYRNVDAITDPLSTTLWYTFFKHYPDSKVILMVRESPAVWLNSLKAQLDYFGSNYMPWYYEYVKWLSPCRRRYDQLMRHIMARNSGCLKSAIWSSGDLSDENAEGQYILHNAAVQHLVPEQQLLIYRVGDGWEPLCRFLDLPVPGTPFPKDNVAGQSGHIIDKLVKFNVFEEIDREVRESMVKAGTLMAAALAGMVYLSL